MEPQPDLELSDAEAERVLEAWLGRPASCSAVRRLEGGLMSSVFSLELDRPPHRAVIKLREPDGDPFGAEARALEYLRAATTCPVPEVYLHDGSGDIVRHACLLLEQLPGHCLQGLELGADDRASLEAELAVVVAELHAHTGEAYGAVGGPARGWPEVVDDRLRHVRAHPALAGRLGASVLARVDAAIDRAPEVLGEPDVPRLIHGDLWEGNTIVRRESDGWRISGLLDPDLQFADVEWELAYLEVFDVRRDAFFAEYEKHRSRREGYERRRQVYWLHTSLVHVALFGDPFFCDYTAKTAAAILDG